MTEDSSRARGCRRHGAGPLGRGGRHGVIVAAGVDKQDEQLVKLSKQILELTRAIHNDASPQAEAAPSSSSNGSNNDQPR